MKMVIEINMDNDAFARGKKAEVRRILNELLLGNSLKDLKDNPKTLMDINGNSVGYAKIEGN